MERLFVYGTLAPGRPNQHILKELDGTWQDATVAGKLYSEGWGAAMGFPGIVLNEPSDEISGLVFSSKDLSDNWSKLDEFEGAEYKRVLTEVKLADGNNVEAYIYVLKER